MPKGVYERKVKTEEIAPVSKLTADGWPKRPGWRNFTDRLDFLSPERQQLNSGRLKILPPRNPERRTKS